MDKRVLKRWDRLLESYFNDPSLSEERRAAIRRRLSDDTFGEEKFAALEKHFTRMVVYDPAPGEDVLAGLQGIKEELGFPEPGSPDYISLGGEVPRRTIIKGTTPCPLRPSRPMMRPSRIVAAAAVAIIAACGTWFYLDPPRGSEAPEVAMLTMSVPDTAQAQGRTELSDGSHIWIKPGTTVSVQEDMGAGAKRRVALAKGELYLNVAKDSSREFVVETPHLDVNVLGTQFDVETAPDKEYTIVTLYEGRVVAEGTTGKGAAEEISMQPGDELFYNNATGDYRIERTTAQLPYWIASRLTFDKTPLPDILRAIEWYYGVQVVVEGKPDNELYTFRFLGKEDIGTAMMLLRHITRDFDYTLAGTTVKVNYEN